MDKSRPMLFVPVAAFLAVAAASSGSARADDGRDFIAEAKVFYRVVACGGSDALPAGVDATVVDRHCAAMAKLYEEFDKTYAKPAADFFASVRPAGLPTTVVYPFGG